jgi:hypothetical protein
MTWLPPKIDWTPDLGVGIDDLNRIEGNIKHLSETVVSTGTDINTLVTNGAFFVSAPVNGPDGTGSVYVQVVAHTTDTNFILQNAYSRGTNKSFSRRKEQGTWTVWTQTSNDTKFITTDINALTENGTYYVQAGAPNLPSAETYYVDHRVHYNSAQYMMQVAYNATNNQVWTRRKDANVWEPWLQLSNFTHTKGVTDCNTLTENGAYLVGPTAPNAPAGVSYAVINVTKSDNSTYVMQQAYCLGLSNLYVRFNNAGTWSPWKAITNDTTQLTLGTNLDTILVNGIYDVSTAVGKPMGSADWIYLEVTAHSNGPTFAMQVATNLNGPPRRWVRNRDSAVWSPWREIGNTTYERDYSRPIPWPSGITSYTLNIVVGGYAYFLYSAGGTGYFYRYDPLANTFTAMATMPDLYGNQIDVVTDGVDLFRTVKWGSTISMYKYTIATNTWSAGNSTNLPEYESLNTSPRAVCYGNYVFQCVSISDGGFGYLYYIRFHKTDLTNTRLDRSDANSMIYTSSYVVGNQWYMGSTYYGNSDKYLYTINLDAFTYDGANLGSGGKVYGASVSPSGKYYGYTSSDERYITTYTFSGYVPVAQKGYVLNTVDSFIMFFPAYGRIIGANGTFQDIPQLVNY